MCFIYIMLKICNIQNHNYLCASLNNTDEKHGRNSFDSKREERQPTQARPKGIQASNGC